LDKDKKSFGLEHCWNILKGEDKWKAKMKELAELEKDKQAAKKKKNSTKDKRPSGEEETQNNELEDVVDEETAAKKTLCPMFLIRTVLPCPMHTIY